MDFTARRTFARSGRSSSRAVLAEIVLKDVDTHMIQSLARG